MRLALALTAAVLSIAASAQDEAETDVERLVRVARTGSPVVRPQAARRLLRHGEEAARVLRATIEADEDGLAALGSDLVAILGRLGDAELRARLWVALDDRDFPWRPSAARSLADDASEDEAERFQALSRDALAAVRKAAIDAFAAYGPRAWQVPLVDELLADPDDRVRRAAAWLRVESGDPRGYVWLVEDLRRDDRFLAVETGKEARYLSFKHVRAGLGEDFGYAPGEPPDAEANVAALARIEARVTELCVEGLPTLPRVARASRDVSPAAFALELRSCRRGEFFLRWSADDVLWVGLGNPTRTPLPAGTTERLLALAERELATLGDERSWGKPGCDVELYRLRADPAARPGVWHVSKGPRAVPDLRPAVLSRVATALVETLPEDDGLRTRVREALHSVGGAP